ncbi:MAG TPA: hypothetical protein VMQ58_01655 [Candidatus Saccharimonadales bacterium]|jgi:hypothetical protein|nr:hypothetical protein [Candidatus Saccharimonadales bacterium]
MEETSPVRKLSDLELEELRAKAQISRELLGENRLSLEEARRKVLGETGLLEFATKHEEKVDPFKKSLENDFVSKINKIEQPVEFIECLIQLHRDMRSTPDREEKIKIIDGFKIFVNRSVSLISLEKQIKAHANKTGKERFSHYEAERARLIAIRKNMRQSRLKIYTEICGVDKLKELGAINDQEVEESLYDESNFLERLFKHTHHTEYLLQIDRFRTQINQED